MQVSIVIKQVSKLKLREPPVRIEKNQQKTI